MSLRIKGSLASDTRLAPHLAGAAAVGFSAEVLGLQARHQSFTMAVSDDPFPAPACRVAWLVVVAFTSAVPTNYRQAIAAPVEAK